MFQREFLGGVLRLTDGHPPLGHQLSEGNLGLFALHHEDGPAVSGGKMAIHQHFPHDGGQGGEPQGVGNGGAGLAHPLGHLFLRHGVVGKKHQIALGFLHGIQVLPLEVFNQAQLHDLLVVGLNDDRRDLHQPRQLGGPPAALPGDDLIVAGGQAADGKGLDNAVLPDGVGQIHQ